MDISIFGFKFNLEVLILIGVIYLILVGHLFCGCCHIGLMEGFDGSGNSVPTTMPTSSTTMPTSSTTMPTSSTTMPMSSNGMGNGMVNSIPTDIPTPSPSKIEGFSGANINYGESSNYNINYNKPINTSNWDMPNMTVTPGKPLDSAVKKFLAREPQPVPLPEGELLMFANTPFKPDCCPNTYSNSMGCACMTADQYNYLILRGGNNVPFSEY